ncbi:MAG TPA: cob(I)yrinic acid a,c-diamide adenosyltransferase [Ktedonobacterales bacterium]
MSAKMGVKAGAKITTKTGDMGLTGVLGPERLPKENPRIEALGAVDEATSALGLARAWSDGPFVNDILIHIQRNLYTLMAELATTTPRANAIGMRIASDDVDWLERTQERLLARVEIPPQFILPGDTRSGATLDFARATVRRAERAVSRLVHAEGVGALANGEALRYLNRLSDLLFVLARVAEAGGSTPARMREETPASAATGWPN